jgi:hypothetical protein
MLFIVSLSLSLPTGTTGKPTGRSSIFQAAAYVIA